MAFTKRDVKDRVVQYPRRYQLVEVQPGIFDLIPVPGVITEEGTPINKAYLQPIEDALADALEKTGDGKDVIVTFTEASAESHIASGEKLSVLFGKILKKFKNVAPTSHASAANTYGLGTTANYGHCKIRNDLTASAYANGEVLSSYQGKILDDKIELMKFKLLKTINIGTALATNQTISLDTDISSYDIVVLKIRGSIVASNSSTNINRFVEYKISTAGGNKSLCSIAITKSTNNVNYNLSGVAFAFKGQYNAGTQKFDFAGGESMTEALVGLTQSGSSDVTGTQNVYLDIYGFKI
jgi:hypothetical protein